MKTTIVVATMLLVGTLMTGCIGVETESPICDGQILVTEGIPIGDLRLGLSVDGENFASAQEIKVADGFQPGKITIVQNADQSFSTLIDGQSGFVARFCKISGELVMESKNNGMLMASIIKLRPDGKLNIEIGIASLEQLKTAGLTYDQNKNSFDISAPVRIQNDDDRATIVRVAQAINDSGVADELLKNKPAMRYLHIER